MGKRRPFLAEIPHTFGFWGTDHHQVSHDTETGEENAIGGSISKRFSRQSTLTPWPGSLVGPSLKQIMDIPKSAVGPSPNKGAPLRSHRFVLALADYATRYPIHLFNKSFFNIGQIHLFVMVMNYTVFPLHIWMLDDPNLEF